MQRNQTCNFTKSNTSPWVFSRFLNCTNGTKLRNASNIVHGDLKIDVTVTKGDLKGILKVMYTLFHDTCQIC